MKRIMIVAFWLYAIAINSQQITVHSPTASNLGLYGEIPVSYYTGTPNIYIPLYEIKGKQITIPIELRYHLAGIRPEIHPGPTGLGWSLQAGGVISRTVRGNSPDESNRKNRAEVVEGYLYYASPSGWIAQENWKDNAKNGLSNDCFSCRNAVWYMAPYSDHEPDEFNFSVLDISGKFYFDHTGKIQVQCDRPIKVVFNNEFIEPNAAEIGLDYTYSNLTIRAFKSFVIIDEQGTQYYFGGANAIEFSDPISYGRDNMGKGTPATGQLLQATSWFLTQIKTANETDVINFEYERGPFVSQLYRSFDYYSYSGANMSGWRYNSIEKDGTLISPVYLKRIVMTDGAEVDLTYSQSAEMKYSENEYSSIIQYASSDNYKLLDMTSAIPQFQPSAPFNKFDRIQWLKLDVVSIKKNQEPLRQINFVYNNNPSERLFLEALNIYGSNTQTPPANYTFAYKNRNRMPTQYLTCITDHWGFNNGKNYPSNGFTVQSKIPDSYYTDSGILSEILYPTGGTTQFEYELHDYSKIVNTKNRMILTNQQGTASGLRIKKIITDGIEREFFYKETPTSSISSGVLNMMPQYIYSINGIDCDGKGFSMSVVRSLPVIPLTKDNEGLYIGYTYVCEKAGNNGYTQYNYTNHDNGHADVLLAAGRWKRDIFPSDPHNSRYFERGRLKKETLYDVGGQEISSNETIWTRYGSQGEDNPRALLFEGIKIGYDYCSSAAYLHYCYKFLPSQKVNITRAVNGQNTIASRTNYEYNTYYLLKGIRTYDSQGNTFEEQIKYTTDFSSVGSYIYENCHYPIEIKRLKNGYLIGAECYNYNLSHPLDKYVLKLNTPIPNENLVNYIDENFEFNNKLTHLEKYNRNIHTQNIEEYIDLKTNVPTTYLWGYNHQYPIAEIINTSYTDVKSVLGGEQRVTEFASRLNPTLDEIKLLLAPLFTDERTKKAMITYYTYKPLVGITSKTDPRGVTTYYDYDGFGRLTRTYIIENGTEKNIETYDYHYKP